MNIALLARVSTQEQAINGHSIGEQVERMRDYCKAMGWNVFKEYIDAGFSGANTDRPALQRMIRDIKAGKIDKVLVYKLDRLSRSQKDTLELIEDVFLANNTDFVSMSENFDTSTPFGRAMIGILAVFAQLEREQIKERMMMGKLARSKQGKYLGNENDPIGYDYIDGELIPNEYEKMLVNRVFEMYAQGMSPKKIAEKLNESGLHHKYGEWIEKTVYNVIKRKTYIGKVPYGGDWYDGIHEPIISEELFYKCQEINERKYKEHKERNRRLGRANSYLGGYLVCKHCGGKFAKNRMSYKSPRNGHVYYYDKYICYSRSKRTKHLIKDPNCKNKIWKMEELDNIVFDEIKKLATDPEYIKTIKDNRPQDERPSIINAEIGKIDDKLEKLMDLYLADDLPRDILQERTNALKEQKAKLEQELEKIENENKKRLSHKEAMQIVESFSEILERRDFDEIRATIGTLIDYIEVDNDDITIHWNFI